MGAFLILLLDCTEKELNHEIEPWHDFYRTVTPLLLIYPHTVLQDRERDPSLASTMVHCSWVYFLFGLGVVDVSVAREERF